MASFVKELQREIYMVKKLIIELHDTPNHSAIFKLSYQKNYS
jgi:hypothetical protein